MYKKFAIVLLFLTLFIAGCTTYEPATEQVTGEVIIEPEDTEVPNGGEPAVEEVPGSLEENEEVAGEGTEEATEEIVEEETAEEELEPTVEEEVPGIVKYEGDLIDLKPYVMDPDGDLVDLGYTSPFNSEGVWQTEEGDAGHYSLIVTATDNKDSFVTKQITLDVLPLNNPPVINIGDKVEFDEGDLVKLNPDVYDEDGDEVVVIYSGWMDTKTYQSTYDDAGEYDVKIRADDSKAIVSKDIKVLINDVNRKPELKLGEYKLSGTEGDLLEIEVETMDADGDDLEIEFSEKFDSDGKWQTKVGDAGSYEIEVKVTDGKNVVTSEVLVELEKKNNAPVIKSVKVSPEEVVLKKPGDKVTIMLETEATDADGDELTYSYSGFMDSSEKTVAYGEKGGLKTVTITVSDGKDSVSTEVSFEMNNWPCFDCQVQ